MSAALGCQLRMHRTNARIVESRAYGERLLYLSVGSLHDECARAVNDTLGTAMHGCGGMIGIYAVSSGLGKVDAHPVVVNIMKDGACSI